MHVFEEDAGEWQAALQIFWEIKMLSGQLSSTHCFDILNRVLVKAGQWQLSLQLMKCMENDNFIPNGMHVASTCRVVMENQPRLAPELLRTALKQWKIVATSNEIRMWHCNLPRILQRAGCNLSILAWQPGILAIAKPPDQTSESILEYLRDKVTRWWFQEFFIFTPKIGEMIQFDKHIFQVGWFNHQPGELNRSRSCFFYFSFKT